MFVPSIARSQNELIKQNLFPDFRAADYAMSLLKLSLALLVEFAMLFLYFVSRLLLYDFGTRSHSQISFEFDCFLKHFYDSIVTEKPSVFYLIVFARQIPRDLIQFDL